MTKACTVTAKVAELVDALDLGSSGETRESSSLSFRTNKQSNSSFIFGCLLKLVFVWLKLVKLVNQ